MKEITVTMTVQKADKDMYKLGFWYVLNDEVYCDGTAFISRKPRYSKEDTEEAKALADLYIRNDIMGEPYKIVFKKDAEIKDKDWTPHKRKSDE